LSEVNERFECEHKLNQELLWTEFIKFLQYNTTYESLS